MSKLTSINAPSKILKSYVENQLVNMPDGKNMISFYVLPSFIKDKTGTEDIE